MADLEHVSVDVEAANAKRHFLEAQHLRERADLAHQEYRDLLAEAAKADDVNQRARIKRIADRVLLQRTGLIADAAKAQAAARDTILRSDSLPNATNLATLEPVTRIPFTDAEVAQHKEEANTIAWERFRAERDELLAASDWRVLPDSPITDKERDAWAKYRQQLRDLPSKTKTPAKASWPKPPKGAT